MTCSRPITAALIAMAWIFAAGPPTADQASETADQLEIAALFQADQAARESFFQMSPEQLQNMLVLDRDRRKRARELYVAGSLRTARDFYHAAMIFQHGEDPDEFLLAHEFAVAALALGESRARWLAAATEDRFLRSLGRKQRFGTQFIKGSNPQDKWQLHPVAEDVTDSFREVFRCPPLAEAQAKAEKLNMP